MDDEKKSNKTEASEVQSVEVDNYDDVDVTAALERETHDGSGFEFEAELPESDFEEDK